MSLIPRRILRPTVSRSSIAIAPHRVPLASRQTRVAQLTRPIWPPWCAPCAFSTCRQLQRTARTDVDGIIEEITELYEAARDEFQIAAEETEDNTVYAADDRIAAREHLEKLQSRFEGIVENDNYPAEVRDEVKRRAGGRVRELANAMQALDEKAQRQD